MSGQVTCTFDTAQMEMGAMHDAQLDYYGKRLAAASGDFSVQVWDISDGQQKLCGKLVGHEGPVWKVSWAHPKFGSILASCSYDMKVIVWKEVQAGQWMMAFVDSTHTASVNDLQFCPWEFGLRLACASSDGTFSVLTYQPQDGSWRRDAHQAHGGGCQALSWAAAQYNDAVLKSTMRLVTGGCDHRVSLWKCEAEVWSQETPPMPGSHADWVRDVAWRPDSSGRSVIASASWDKSVIIWAQEMDGQPWRQACRIPLADKVENLSWSITGSILSVAYGEGEVVLYKEAIDGRYEEVGKVSEAGYQELQVARPAEPQLMAAEPAMAAAPMAPPPGSELAAQQQSVMDAFGI
jgi:protein transport protein SEC13